jgi:hypothetical protein
VGRHLDSPSAGERRTDPVLDVSGWAIGRDSPVVAVEVTADDAVLRRIPVRLLRPDVADAHAGAPGALRSGFRGGVGVRGGDGEARLIVQAVFADELREPIAALTIRRREDPEYVDLVSRIRQAVAALLESEAGLVVFHEGDIDLLRFDGRRTWGFPATDLEPLRESWPANAVGAVAHLEALRAEGGAAVVIPRPAFWWLDHFPGFRQHLERRYPLLLDVPDCRVFRLAAARRSGAAAVDLQAVIAESRERLGRDPSILDAEGWQGVAGRFDDEIVFSPFVADASLLVFHDYTAEAAGPWRAQGSRA